MIDPAMMQKLEEANSLNLSLVRIPKILEGENKDEGPVLERSNPSIKLPMGLGGAASRLGKSGGPKRKNKNGSEASNYSSYSNPSFKNRPGSVSAALSNNSMSMEGPKNRVPVSVKSQ